MPNMKIGIIGIPEGWSSELLLKAVQEKTGFGLLMAFDDIIFDLDKGQAFYDDMNLLELDGLIVKKLGSYYSHHILNRIELISFLEKKGLRVFSKPSGIRLAVDRITNTMILRSANINMPATIITENINLACETAKRFRKAVFKPIFSTKARGMMLLENDENAYNKIKNYHKINPIMYIQKFERLPGRDLGIVFLGEYHIGTYARISKGDTWITTTAFGGEYRREEPEEKILKIAKKAQSLFDLDFTCIDIAETDNGPIVFEVSAFGGFRGLYNSWNINAAELYADYVIERLK